MRRRRALPIVAIVDVERRRHSEHAGSATITATTDSGIKASTTIAVVAARLEPLRIDAADTSGSPLGFLGVGKTRRLVLNGVYSDRSVANHSAGATWISKDEDTVSVDNAATKGLLTAKRLGAATIVVTYGTLAPVEQLVVVVP